MRCAAVLSSGGERVFIMFKSRLLLFDIDGTLIRTDKAGMRAFNRGFFETLGWPDALSRISPAGMTDLGIARQVAMRFQGRPLTDAQTQAVFRRYLECLPDELRNSAGYRVLPGIAEFLEQQSRRPGVLLGLGTGNLESGARIKLDHGGLNPYFAFGGFGSDAEERTEVLRVAVQRAEKLSGQAWPLERVLVIGDTPLDVAAGKALGARTVGVATGPFRKEELLAAGADDALETFADLEGLGALRLD